LKDSTGTAKERIDGARHGPRLQEAAVAIQQKHGRQKGGLPMTWRKMGISKKQRTKRAAK
jgi:hypothetical protein